MALYCLLAFMSMQAPVIKKGTILPAKGSNNFTTLADRQTVILFQVTRGFFSRETHAKSLCRCCLDFTCTWVVKSCKPWAHTVSHLNNVGFHAFQQPVLPDVRLSSRSLAAPTHV